jgi:hypothetical protein
VFAKLFFSMPVSAPAYLNRLGANKERIFSSSSKFNLPGSSKVTQPQGNCRVLARFWPRLVRSFLEGDASAAKFGIAEYFLADSGPACYTLRLGKFKVIHTFSDKRPVPFKGPRMDDESGR